MAVFSLRPTQISFPDPAYAEASGLLAIGGGLSPEQLISAYTLGIFPWYDEKSPILWWSPDPRCILLPQHAHVPRSLSKALRNHTFTFTFDEVFAQVVQQCSKVHEHEGTWLVPEMIEAYTRLHLLGVAHSVEIWQNNKLVGGLYGVSLGGVFFGESMFYTVSNASKAGLIFLIRFLAAKNFLVLDCQQTTAHMVRFGAVEVAREKFTGLLEQAFALPTLQGSWKKYSDEVVF